MDLKTVQMSIPSEANLVLGQSHFIKTVEDIYEAIVNTVPGAKFGVAFSEASGPCLVRVDGNDEELQRVAAENSLKIGAGHTFVLLIENAYPINIMDRLKACPEICTIFCATANPVQVILAETEQGRGIVGVIDGSSPAGIEGPEDVSQRKQFLRTIGYKR